MIHTVLTVKYNLQYDHLDEKNEELFYPVRYLSLPSRENLRNNGDLRHEMRLVISTPIISACQIARLLPPADVQPDNARKQPLGRSMEAISHKHFFTEKSKLLPSKPYLCLHLFKNSKTPQTTWRQLGGSGSGGRSKRYTYEINDINIINFLKKIHFN